MKTRDHEKIMKRVYSVHREKVNLLKDKIATLSASVEYLDRQQGEQMNLIRDLIMLVNDLNCLSQDPVIKERIDEFWVEHASC